MHGGDFYIPQMRKSVLIEPPFLYKPRRTAAVFQNWRVIIKPLFNIITPKTIVHYNKPLSW